MRQDLTRIDDAAGGRLDREQPGAARRRCATRARLHLIGLVSDGGVHSSLEHLDALIAMAAQAGVPGVIVHAFTDGRDTLPTGRGRLPGARSRLRAARGR